MKLSSVEGFLRIVWSTHDETRREKWCIGVWRIFCFCLVWQPGAACRNIVELGGLIDEISLPGRLHVLIAMFILYTHKSGHPDS